MISAPFLTVSVLFLELEKLYLRVESFAYGEIELGPDCAMKGFATQVFPGIVEGQLS